MIGTVWADTVWADIWGPIWGSSSVAPPQQEAQNTGGWYLYDPPEQPRRKAPKEDDQAPEEIAEFLPIPTAEPALAIEFDFDRIAQQVARIAKNEREQREFEEIAYLMAVSEAKRRDADEIFAVVRLLYSMVM